MPDSAAAKILVADDDQSLVRTLMWILKENGYEVVVAPGGEGLMGKLEEERPHLLLLDIMMPKVDGLQLLAKMKADERFRDLLVLHGEGQRDRGARRDGDALALPARALLGVHRVGGDLLHQYRAAACERALDLGVAGQLDLQVAQHRILVRGHHDPQLLARLREHPDALGGLEHAPYAPHQDVVDLVGLERVRDLVQDVDDGRATLRFVARARQLLGGADVSFDAGEQLAHAERFSDEVRGAEA